MTFNALRFFIAVLFLVPVKLIIDAVKRRRQAVRPGTDEAKRASRRTLIVAGLLCGLALGVASFLQQAGMEAGTDAGKSGFITAMYVVLVPVGGLILGRRLPKIFWAGLALAVAGLYLLCISGKLTFTSGDLLTLLCAVAFTVQILLIDRFAKSLDPVLFCIAEFITAGVFSAIGVLLFERPDWGEALRYALPVLYVAIFSCGIAYLLQIVAQRDGNPAIVSLLFSMESVFSVIGGAILLHQRMTAREYVGCALILAAVIIAQIPEKPKRTE
jgi:drug/metabolite transporter (DMT)-like permease